MATTNKFVTIPNGEFHGVYQLDETRYAVPPDDGLTRPQCECCKKAMTPAFDVMQMGFWQDHCQTYFVCPDCKKAWLYIYDLSRIEPSGKKRSKRKVGQE